jgi:hypothetical protein
VQDVVVEVVLEEEMVVVDEDLGAGEDEGAWRREVEEVDAEEEAEEEAEGEAEVVLKAVRSLS